MSAPGQRSQSRRKQWRGPVAFTESFGAVGMRANDPEDLATLIPEALALQRPVVIHVPFGESYPAPPTSPPSTPSHGPKKASSPPNRRRHFATRGGPWQKGILAATQRRPELWILKASQLRFQLSCATFSVHGTRLGCAAGGPLIGEGVQVGVRYRVPKPQIPLFPAQV